ncbi:protease modulator HflC [Orrella marina]|uniref:Protein HflC n=1 Tax=Orrella marina TaxID=2163011 RepID=A0A2R4XI58_9BURK|nr:protease modulator HflC [Orrella marina]AWB33496.1 protease modulator HflC [Orrella marina]
MSNKLTALLVAIALIGGLLSSMMFTVGERNYALVFALGEVKRVIRDPGLHFKLPPPFQNVVMLDRRLLTISFQEPERIQTSEKKNLLIDSFVKWRIADPRLYYVTFAGNERAAIARLQAQIRDALNASVNIRTVKDVVALERDVIMTEVLENVKRRAEPLGVEVVDVRLMRIEFAPEIAESVFRRMESERLRVANELRSIGAAEGEKIRASADRERQQILAEAYARAQSIMGEGDAQAAELYRKAYGQDSDFFSFYRSLEAYREAFGKQSDVMVVDPSSDFFRYMKSATGGVVPASVR